jgi:perosamine synthetase
MSHITEIFFDKIQSVIRNTDKAVSLHEPLLDKEDAACVSDVISSGWVSYQGEMVRNFEKSLEEYLSVPHVISIVNGTEALFIALKALGIEKDNEIIVPSLTFAATANAVCHVGAIPHFVDSCEKTFAIDFDKLEDYLQSISYINDSGKLVNKNTNNIIKAIIPVYVFGAAFDIKKLEAVARKFNLQIIEDAAEALGSEYQAQKISALTGVGILSFNGNKIITTGGGGAVVVKDAELAKKIRHLSTTAKKPHRYEFEHDEIGYNLRLPAINAALGYSQMQKLESFLRKKRSLHKMYADAFAKLDIGCVFDPNYFGLSNNWLNAFVLEPKYRDEKNTILNYLNDRGIQARPFWRPLHTLEIYDNCPRSDCSTAFDLYERVICLPSSVFLGDDA